MDPCPSREAKLRAVSPSLFCISTDAPARIRESTTDPCPMYSTPRIASVLVPRLNQRPYTHNYRQVV